MEKVTTIVQIALKHVWHSCHNITLCPHNRNKLWKKYNSVNIQKVSQHEFLTRISVFRLGFSYSIHPFGIHCPISNFASLFIMLKGERKCFFSFLCCLCTKLVVYLGLSTNNVLKYMQFETILPKCGTFFPRPIYKERTNWGSKIRPSSRTRIGIQSIYYSLQFALMFGNKRFFFFIE